MSKAWCFTLNNYTDEDIKRLPIMFAKMHLHYLFAKEVGDSGTPHLQGYIYGKVNIKMEDLKKVSSRMHLEKAKGDQESNIRYCTKEGGEFFSDFYEPVRTITTLRPWQKEALKFIHGSADDRSIIWIFDRNGGVGKSSFCKWLVQERDAIYLTEGQKSDLINIVYNAPLINSKSIIAIDIPRANGSHCSYKAFEEIKNGCICNTKYETGMKTFNSPHMIIFSNDEPQYDQMSDDRWCVLQVVVPQEHNPCKDDILIWTYGRGFEGVLPQPSVEELIRDYHYPWRG